VVDDNSHLRATVSTDGAAILDVERGKISTLNTTGAYVWQALQRGENLETIVANLAHETGEQADRLKRDVMKFIDDLTKQHLLSY
jgi:Coenzyme PQQ synthesis protein D (PqqD)